MDEILLDVELRTEIGTGKAKGVRDHGLIPAVIYGEGKKSQAVKVSHSGLLHLVHQHRLENMVITLKLKDDAKSKNRSCIIKEIQYDPVHGNIIHVDFNEISLTKAIKVNVPVKALGEPAGVKQDGGSLEHIMWEIEIECLPTDIPKEIEVDVSALKIGDSIHVKDLTFSPKLKVLSDQSAVVLSVAAPIKEEVAVEGAEGEEKVELEVIKEKKEVPGEGAEEAKDKGKEKEKK